MSHYEYLMYKIVNAAIDSERFTNSVN